MADLATQVLPVASALAGVALTLVGNVYLERGKWQRTRHTDQEARSLQAYADLLQAVTDIARTLRQTAEQFGEGHSAEMQEVVTAIDNHIAQVRRHGTMVRLVGPRSAFGLVKSLEDQIAPLYRLLVAVERSGDGTPLVEPARRLMRTRDEITDHLRRASGLS
ncbi:hypothetical protein PV729_25715 [Streptomyces europaeiscabiei]|uniref:Secreted protein n=1 Tax=Streptomyces europaeiscabiei TaxID=146819 RepID=A0ABU4NSH6_9ACTN|nr:hypothetical protein [Streptomyces europaeiscabiei]MDX3548828.1 hypothetical protein [Streptomyces europaeiscabiei]MDX3555118.1 hypothetical protein [Streptomyces europaeiscabiei]MDX3705132.1 hypothetical protein [Streptomyces europaeiscabiei]